MEDPARAGTIGTRGQRGPIISRSRQELDARFEDVFTSLYD
jgi:hypothetical protein